jgi:uncharacterized protein (UPF0332 family)
MIFDWSQFITLAKELFQCATDSTQEPELRSAVSRAYFGAFCLTRNFLRDKEGDRFSGKAEDHQKVYNILVSSNDSRRRQIAENLHRLRIDRNKADYDDSIPGLYQKASTALTWANRVILNLGKI